MSEAAVERTLTLPPDPSSASIARRLLRELLVECGRGDWLDSAELALSELVTNVVLHAHTPMVLRATCGSELRVEVADGSSAWPAQREYGEQATTGRGMGLVAAVTQDHGTSSTPGGGKTVWFVVNDSPDPGGVEALGDWSDVVAGHEEPQRAGSRRVLLPQLPSTLWLAAEQRHDALFRELALGNDERASLRDDLVRAERATSTLAAAVHRVLADAKARGRR